MESFEGLGAFYLGRPHDLATGQPGQGVVLLDSNDLLTHALCVGMTGSGKTGLCLSILEEAALDGIPAIAIDPKGDLGNLMLTFPDLAPADFAPWVDADEARRRGIGVDEHARQQATLWREGLAKWGQDGDRIRRLRDAADVVIYTPGSEAGLQLSIVASLGASGAAALDAESLRERVTTVASSLLALLGLDADPIRSRDHVLLATILDHAWRAGQDLDLPRLIHAIQDPPATRVGVLDLESFYPARERFALAMSLNNVLASPGFAAWLAGAPLDVGDLLHGPDGRPRIAIVSIAHLSDAERMFFVSLLLGQVVAWMRGLSGTASLRALLFIDEIFGFVPPVANPPSKLPLLTLLKQGRAFGLGVVLATQNPVDLDYKGLSNIGTWFLGRLQTERDKLRVLDGLESAAGGDGFERSELDSALSALRSRLFVVRSAHARSLQVLESRWAMSYLRGPMTRAEIQRVMSARKATQPTPSQPVTVAPPPAPTAASSVQGPTSSRLLLPPDVPQVFLPAKGPMATGCALAPKLLGLATVRYADTKAGVDHEEAAGLLLDVGGDATPTSWTSAVDMTLREDELRAEPTADCVYLPVAAAAVDPRRRAEWSKDLVDELLRRRRLVLYRHPKLGVTSRPGETERDFRIRISEDTRVERDRLVAELRRKHEAKIATLEGRVQRARDGLARRQQAASHEGVQAAISIGSTILSAFFGRRRVGAGTLGRATTAARGMTRTAKKARDASQASETVEQATRALEELNAELEAEAAELLARLDPRSTELETSQLRPRRGDVDVRLLAIAWQPVQEGGPGSRRE